MANLFLFLLVGSLGVSTNAATRALRDVYGLYYADWGGEESAISLVISPNDKPLPPKANDPGSPTKPGFYLKNQRYPFASSKLSGDHFSFKTSRVGGIRFSFEGVFGRERVEEIPNVPYLEGTIVETQRDGKTQKTKIHFGHAVVL